ncbi:MAG: glycosyltransferase [Bacteroidales bacterium]|nr:glycosyltransferase [Candidatus Cryptobacteroides equifaecalis]
MKRVLVISYYWPPTGGSGVQRWVKFVKYLPQMGWEPVVYTPENPEQLAVDESLLKDIPEGIEVLKTRIFEPYEAYRTLTGKKKGGGEVNPLNAGRKSLMQRLAVAARGNLFIPDPRIGWVRPSVRFLRKYLAEHPVDVIVTTGPPQSVHLIGRGLKRATGVRWIADFRDPWTDMFYFKHMGLSRWAERRHHRLEQSVLDEADAIISVTPLVQKDFQAKTSTPVHMITNGFDRDDFPSLSYSPGEKFSIVHTGLFAADGNPLALWKVLADKCAADGAFADALQIRLAGKTDAAIVEAIRAAGLGDKLVNLGYLPHSEIVKEQCRASVLILPLRQEPEYLKVLPGKIFEYLASGRPVLGIGQEEGAAAAVLADASAGQMYDWDREDAMASFIDRQWQARLSGQDGAVCGDIEKYSRKELTRRLIEIL